MSDENIKKLTDDEKEKIISWMNVKAQNIKCNGCGGNQFSIAEHIVQTPLFKEGKLFFGGPEYPMFIIFCDNCGCAQFFSAIKSGIVSKD